MFVPPHLGSAWDYGFHAHRLQEAIPWRLHKHPLQPWSSWTLWLVVLLSTMGAPQPIPPPSPPTPTSIADPACSVPKPRQVSQARMRSKASHSPCPFLLDWKGKASVLLLYQICSSLSVNPTSPTPTPEDYCGIYDTGLCSRSNCKSLLDVDMTPLGFASGRQSPSEL